MAAKKEKEIKTRHFSVEYHNKNGAVKDVKIKITPLTLKNVLFVCEKLFAQNIFLESNIKVLQEEIESLNKKSISLSNNISTLNGLVLKHETELYHKPWFKKFIGL